MATKRRWVRVAVDVLVEVDGEGSPSVDVSKVGSSVVVAAQRGEIRDYRVRETRTWTSARVVWSSSDDAMLGTVPDGDVAAIMGLSRAAVAVRRNALGIAPCVTTRPVERCSRLSQFYAVLEELAPSGPITTSMLQARGFSRQRLSKLVKRLPSGFEMSVVRRSGRSGGPTERVIVKR